MGRRIAIIAVFISALVGALGTSAFSAGAAQAAPPTLAGEVFFGANFDFAETSPQCQVNGDGTTTYTISNHGFAVGPYLCTFTEDITVTIVARISSQPFPQIHLPIPPFPNDPPIPGAIDVAQFFQHGPLVSVSVDFAIDAPEGQVTGTKAYSGTLPSFDTLHSGACTDFNNSQVHGFYKDVRAFGILYEAIIQTDGGSYVDEGVSNLQARQGFAFRNDNSGYAFRFNDLFEDFTSDLTAPVSFKPGLGCGDVNHEHERRGECKNL